MYKIYYSPQSCSFSTHAFLEEIQTVYESILISVPKGDHLKEAFKKINPLSKIPVLEHENTYITESAAILIYLADQHKTEFLPSQGTDRALVLSALTFFVTTIHPNFFIKFRPNRFLPADEPYQALQNEADARLLVIFEAINQRLEKSEYYHGDQIRISDFALFNYGRWGGLLSKPTKDFTHFHRFMNSMAQRDSIRKTLDKEGIGLYRDVAPVIS